MTQRELNTVDHACYLAERVGEEIVKVSRRELRELLQYVPELEARVAELEATVKAMKVEVGK